MSVLDSSGVHMRVAARRSTERRQGAVLLVRVAQNVEQVLALTGTESLFAFVAAEGDR